MMLGTATTALASRGDIVDGFGDENVNDSQLPEVIEVTVSSDHGERTIADEPSSESVTAYLTTYDSIYQTQNGQYLKYRNSSSLLEAVFNNV